jgi:oligopeptide/dipeptide ABC transporter ATP-binding protein
VGRALIGLTRPTGGKVFFDGIDLSTLSFDQIRPLRRRMQFVFQDPYSSLNPRMTVRDLISEPLLINHMMKKSEVQDKVAQMLLRVGLRPEYMSRYPHAFSGGQRQRIGIARAISLNPRFVICDEAVSSLDVSVQAQVLGLLEDLQAEYHMSYLFIAHDLSAVKHISDRVVVMYVGKVVEIAKTEELFENPRHPYTIGLFGSIPSLDKDVDRLNPIQGLMPDPADLPAGCTFHERCSYACEECKTSEPENTEIEPGHFVRCLRVARGEI